MEPRALSKQRDSETIIIQLLTDSDSFARREALGQPIKIAFTNKLLKIKSKIKIKVSLCVIKRHNVQAYEGVEV